MIFHLQGLPGKRRPQYSSFMYHWVLPSEHYSFTCSWGRIYGHILLFPLLQKHLDNNTSGSQMFGGNAAHMAFKSPRDLIHICFTVDSTFPITSDAPHWKEELGLHAHGTHKSCVSVKYHQWRRLTCREEVTTQEENTLLETDSSGSPSLIELLWDTNPQPIHLQRQNEKASSLPFFIL